MFKDCKNTETVVLVALLIGVALGTVSGYSLALEHHGPQHYFQVDNRE